MILAKIDHSYISIEFVDIPSQCEANEHKMMKDFAHAVESEFQRQELLRALTGKGPLGILKTKLLI